MTTSGVEATRSRALSRRSFLRGTVAGSVAAVPLLTRQAWAEGVAAPEQGTLVVLSLRGGFDGLSAVVPIADPAYTSLRPTIAIPASRALPTGDRRFGLHPALAPLLPYWQNGTFGAVHAVGTPDQSRSHFEASEELERAAPGSSIRTGWLARVLGQQHPLATLACAQLGSGLASPVLAGQLSAISTRSLAEFSLLGSWAGPSYAAAINSMYSATPDRATVTAKTALSSLDATAAALAAAPEPAAGVGYPSGDLGAALRDAAVLLKADVGARALAIDVGDWDMHAGLGASGTGWMADQLATLAAALAAFAADIGPTRLQSTTVVTLSEFGRRVDENASAGVDHGHGNAVLFLGGRLRGGTVHGSWPGLGAAQRDHGCLAGTTDYRDVLWEILSRRCGVSDVGSVFPGHRPRAVGIA